jgi:hypothetical protein
MDILREKLIYNTNSVHICMKDFSKQDHYEIIRLLLATRTKDVCVCTHESTNTYVESLLKQLTIKFYQCFQSEKLEI